MSSAKFEPADHSGVLVRLIHLTALIYPALLVYGSLFPWANWTATGTPVLSYLTAPFPRYWTGLDLLANVGLYVPLGFFWALWILARPRLQKYWWNATFLALALSFGVETLQNWLPSRVPSNVDLVCNGLGALMGALMARYFGGQWISRGYQWAQRWLLLDASGELGVFLLIFWFVGQWAPDGVLFASGHWRNVWLTWPPDWMSSASESAAARWEAAAVAAYLVAIGLMLRELLRCGRRQSLSIILLIFMVAATARAVSAAVMLRTSAAFDWLTYGAQTGLLVGGLILIPAVFLPGHWRRYLAIVALLAGTLAVNLSGTSPYFRSLVPAGSGSAFYNLAGLTELVALLWPLAALIWWISRSRRSPIMSG